MKFLIVFALAMATASAFHLRGGGIENRNVVVSVLEAEGRITHGKTASVGQFPYQVGLSLIVDASNYIWCGGSLIGNKWVLTAAHCTEVAQSITVYLGATDINSPEVTYTVSNTDVIIHPGWNRTNSISDISLIKIPAVDYTTRIQAVKLPAISSSYLQYVGDYVIATGWGKTSDSATDGTNDLQWARMKVVNNTVCVASYGPSIKTATTICVSTTGGVSICNGDDGGPLVLESSHVQVGVGSFIDSEGCENGLPAGFTRITKYLKWIKDITGI